MTASETQTELTYHRLRADILNGQLRPGSALQFAQLRETYATSMGVLREALTRLAAEGLAVSRAQRGFRVVELSLKDLNDLTDSRVLIETAVLREAIDRGDLDWESRIVSSFHRMTRTEKHVGGDENTVTDDWAQAHQSFHFALLSAAPNARLMAIADGLRASAELYRRWSMPYETTKRDVDAEHRALMELALARKSDEACEALAGHLSFTRELIVKGTGSARQ
ncbi:MAG: GntR family transcriptional regulator [Pseudomonadota bacterium]